LRLRRPAAGEQLYWRVSQTDKVKTTIIVHRARLKSAQIARHFAERPQHNSIPKLTAARIACTTESHSAYISLSPRQSFGAHDGSACARTFSRFAWLRAVVASAERERDVIG
jgi:hypothetical protein